MSALRYKPVLIRQVRLWWYAAALVPILVLGYVSFAGLVSPFLGLIALFALFFWIFSFGFAIARKLKKSPTDRLQ